MPLSFVGYPGYVLEHCCLLVSHVHTGIHRTGNARQQIGCSPDVSSIQCTLCSKKSDAKIKITITIAHLIRINYPLNTFSYRLSDTNIANFNKIHHMVSE